MTTRIRFGDRIPKKWKSEKLKAWKVMKMEWSCSWAFSLSVIFRCLQGWPDRGGGGVTPPQSPQIFVFSRQILKIFLCYTPSNILNTWPLVPQKFATPPPNVGWFGPSLVIYLLEILSFDIFYFWKFSFRYLVSNSSIRCTRYFLEYFSVCEESQISIAQIIELMIWIVLAVFWIASHNSDKDWSQQSRSCLASVLLNSLVFFLSSCSIEFFVEFISSFSVVYDEFLASSYGYHVLLRISGGYRILVRGWRFLNDASLVFSANIY